MDKDILATWINALGGEQHLAEMLTEMDKGNKKPVSAAQAKRLLAHIH